MTSMPSIAALRFVLLLALPALAGCGLYATRIYSLETPCSGRDVSRLFADLTNQASRFGMAVRLVNLEIGSLEVSTPGENVYPKNRWTFNLHGDTLFAQATVDHRSRNGNTGEISFSTEYIDDDESSDSGWYWEMRERLESLCGAKGIVRERTK